jgi:hypothetical protein
VSEWQAEKKVLVLLHSSVCSPSTSLAIIWAFTNVYYYYDLSAESAIWIPYCSVPHANAVAMAHLGNDFPYTTVGIPFNL